MRDKKPNPVKATCRCGHPDCPHPAPIVEPERATPWVAPGEEYEVPPHVHEPAGPGEYCMGCFDQGAVWAKHEERARVRRIIKDSDLHAGAKRYLLAALDEGANDA